MSKEYTNKITKHALDGFLDYIIPRMYRLVEEALIRKNNGSLPPGITPQILNKMTYESNCELSDLMEDILKEETKKSQEQCG